MLTMGEFGVHVGAIADVRQEHLSPTYGTGAAQGLPYA